MSLSARERDEREREKGGLSEAIKIFERPAREIRLRSLESAKREITSLIESLELWLLDPFLRKTPSR